MKKGMWIWQGLLTSVLCRYYAWMYYFVCVDVFYLPAFSAENIILVYLSIAHFRSYDPKLIILTDEILLVKICSGWIFIIPCIITLMLHLSLFLKSTMSLFANLGVN